MTFDDFIGTRVVGDPHASPDGKRVAYTVTEYSLQENRGTTRIWLADVSGGGARALDTGAGSARQPRWSRDGKHLAFISTRENGAQLWIMPVSGGEPRRLTDLPEGAGDPVWMPDGASLLVVGDVRWPAEQEIDRRHGPYPTNARIWTELFYRHWNAFRAGRRQHVFRVDVATGAATDLTPVDHDVPTLATGGDGDVAVSPDGKEIALAMHGDTVVADNTNVDIYLMGATGGGMLPLTAANTGADHTPRWSPDGRWLAYLSMERPGSSPTGGA